MTRIVFFPEVALGVGCGDHLIKLNLFKNYSSLPIRFIKEEKKERRTKQVISVILNITNSVDFALMLRVLFFPV